MLFESWAEVGGRGVNMIGTEENVADGLMPVLISYTVPSGYKFYLTQLSWYGRATGAITCYAWNYDTNTYLFRGGANVGNAISFAKPIFAGDEGERIDFAVGNYTGATVERIFIYVGGVLIEK